MGLRGGYRDGALISIGISWPEWDNMNVCALWRMAERWALFRAGDATEKRVL